MRKLQRIVSSSATTTTTVRHRWRRRLLSWKQTVLVVLLPAVVLWTVLDVCQYTGKNYNNSGGGMMFNSTTTTTTTVGGRTIEPQATRPLTTGNATTTAPIIHLGTYRGNTLIAHPSNGTTSNTNVTPTTVQWPTVTTTTRKQRQQHYNDMVCTWQPFDMQECQDLLQRRLPSLHHNRTTTPTKKTSTPPPLYMFGDSTMFRLYNGTSLRTQLVDRPLQHLQQCTVRTTDWCNMTYGHPSTLPLSDYRKPDVTREGPVTTGWHKPGCSDCGGCESHFLDCPVQSRSSTAGGMGGFVHMEFARDVEWQTDFFSTTQENLARLLLPRKQAICFLGAGFHDMIMPLQTIPRFQRNVAWVVELFLHYGVCQHIVWILNNAPLYEEHENYTQTVGRVREWNEAVVDTFVHRNDKNDAVRPHVTIVDVFDAARDQHHCDNIHMGWGWYKALSELVLWCLGPPPEVA